MAIEVEGPDGSVVEFPDGTANEVIKGAMAKHFGSPTPQPQPTPQQQTDAMSVPEKFGRGTAYGLLNGAEGVVNTLGKSVEGADPQKLAKLHSLVEAVKERMGVTPDQYAPASGVTQDANAPIEQRLLNVPRSVVEMAGPAVVGGALGGLPGAVATIGATEAGTTIDRVREADKTAPDQELTAGQKARVAAKVATDMGLAALGGKATLGAAAPIMSTGLQGLKQAATQTGKAVGIDALLGSEATAADKVLVDKQVPTASDLAVGAAQGGLPGLAARGPKDFAGGIKARENILKDLNPESLNRLNERIQTHKEAGAGNPLGAAKSDLQNEIGFYRTENSPLLKDIAEKTGHTDTTKVSLDNAIDAVKENRPVPEKTLEQLTNTLGGTYHGDNLLRLLSDHEALNKVNDLSQSSLSNSKLGQVIKPFGKWPASGLDLGALAVIANGLSGAHLPYFGAIEPTTAAALLGAQTAGYLGMKGIDRLTGASDINSLVNKVSQKSGGDTGAQITSTPYQLLDQIKASKNQEFRNAAKDMQLKLKQDVAEQRKASQDFRTAAKEDIKSNKAEQKAADQKLREERYKLNVMRASENQAPLASDASLALRSAKLRQELEAQNAPPTSSDATLALRTAKLRQELEAQNAAPTSSDASLALRLAKFKQDKANEVLRNVGRQKDIMLRSQEASSSPTALALAVARLKQAGEAVQAPEVSTGPSQNVPLPELVSSDARLALKVAKLKQANQAKIEKTKIAQENKAANEAKKAQAAQEKQAKTEARAKVKAQKQKEAASDVIEDDDYYMVKVRGMEIRQPKDGIERPAGWARATRDTIEYRGGVIDEMKKAAPSLSSELRTLEGVWSNKTRTPKGGVEHFYDFVEQHAPDVQKKLKSIFNKHEAKLKEGWTKSK
jgi:hypothetical protein